MAAAQQRADTKLSLEIRTKSVEQTLVPLVTQITTLVNHKERAIKSEKTLRALVRVGQAVNLAVDRFVTVGEKIAEENPEISHDMFEACRDAKVAGTMIAKLTDIDPSDPDASKAVGEKTAMVRAARQLLSAITKVLLMADRIVVKQLLAAKDKVTTSMVRIERVNNFTDFVKSFSQFGNDMVELAHMTGDRQNDLKSDKQRAQIGAARVILEKATMMLLTCSKAYLRHPECASARANRDNVFHMMRRSLDNIHYVVTDGINLDGDTSPTPTANGDSGISLAQHQPTASKAIKEFDDLVEMTRVTLVGPNTEGKLQSALETMVETTQDFTDSAYTSHENRERILLLCERVRQELHILLRIGVSLDQKDNIGPNHELETAIIKTKEASKNLRKQLNDTAMDQASDLFKSNEDHELLTALKTAGMAGQRERVDELSVKFEEHSEQLQEVCKLLRHIAITEPLIVWTEHAETCLKTIGPEEQAKIAKLGLEMKLITSEMDAETDKWEEPDNEIVRRVKNMSSMAFSMYLFTRGEGPLKTTQDLFTQAEYFAEEGAKLFKAVKDFSQSVPGGSHRTDLLGHLERLPILCQQLNFTIKSPTVGKSATFNKVDGVIQETKNLMNAVAKVVTTCFICATKYNIDYRGAGAAVPKWRHPGQFDLNGGSGGTGSDGTGSDRESVKSSKSGRSEHLMRSSSLNRPMSTFNQYDRL